MNYRGAMAKGRGDDDETRAETPAKKEAELLALQKAGRPLVIATLLVAMVAGAAALGGSSMGLPKSTLVFTAILLTVLIAIRMPQARRMGELTRELRELREGKRSDS
jgi:hypothetical protein